MTPVIELRSAEMTDAQLLFEWRNDPSARVQFLDPEPIKWDEHVAWLQDALVSESHLIRIAEVSGTPVGTVRGQLVEGAWRLSWSVAVSARGRGIASEMVRQLVDLLEGPVFAEIKAGNVASNRIAERLGMKLCSTVDGVHRYSLET